MLISEKMIEKEFKADTMKHAFLDCSKWVSTNVLAVNNSKNITYKMEKQENINHTGCIKLTVYVSAEEKEVFEHNCALCSEFAGAFYNKENKYRCEVCKMPPYRNRMLEKLERLKQGLKGVIIR